MPVTPMPIPSPTDAEAWRRAVADGLDRQGLVLEQLRARSVQQRELVASGDSEGLLALLAERQRLVDELTRLSESLRPLRAQWDLRVRELPEAQRVQLRRRVEELTSAAAGLAAADQADRDELVRRREAVRVELSRAGAGRGALAAYGGGARAESTLKDQEA